MIRRLSPWVAVRLVMLLLTLGASGEVVARRPSTVEPRPELTPKTVPPIASYILTARLDADTHTIRSSGTIHFKNPSHRPTQKLFFHLYLNAFESEETLFLRGKASRSGPRPGASGKIVVHSLTSPTYAKKELWPEGAHSPGDAKDRTDIEVALPRPLAGHEEIDLHIEFTSHLPLVIERTGFERDFFLVGHWYPKLAKREPQGEWAHFPFHPNGEFYADFGNYEVTLVVPRKYVVASTGQLTELDSAEKGLRRYHAEAQGVHDFAWTAWPGFVEERRNLRGVQVSLLHPEHTPRVAKRTWDTLDRGLQHLGAAYGPYPHPTLTVVQTPTWAPRAGGMEYPQFITTGGSEPRSFLGIRDIELLTVHELGHQWFQGMLASDEMAHPFLDEGINSYAEGRYLHETYGEGSLVDWPWLKISRLAGSHYVNMRYPGKGRISTSAPEFDSFGSIGSLVYARSALALETLGNVYGQEKLHDALALYSKRFRFRHPTPQDFFRTLGEVLGKKCQKQAELMFNERGWIDFSVRSVQTLRENNGYASSITVGRQGTLRLPTTVDVLFVEGPRQRLSFPADEEEVTFVVKHQSPIRWTEVDSERRVILDKNLENNRATLEGVSPRRDQQLQSALAIFSWALSWISL